MDGWMRPPSHSCLTPSSQYKSQQPSPLRHRREKRMEIPTPETECPVSNSVTRRKTNSNRRMPGQRRVGPAPEEDMWAMKGVSHRVVTLEAEVVEPAGDGTSVVARTKSLTSEDLQELKGCLDLGFGFSYQEIPELCSTLPALDLCYSMTQGYLDSSKQQCSPGASTPSSPIPNWKISNPGDHPDEVKARLKYWAQAVACTVRLCN